MSYIYAPGCALLSYKPELAEKLKTVITSIYGPMETLLPCCFHAPQIESGTQIITPCATCSEKYDKQCGEGTSIFFLTQLAESKDFPFPDYGGISMSIQDTCSARKQPEVLATIRRLLERMNIQLIEPARTGEKAKCCGQTLYGKIDTQKVEAFMKGRADEMPCEDVVVYCASCIMSMNVGGKRPRYIIDLLFNEPTNMQTKGADAWNKKLNDFRKAHQSNK